MAYLDHAATTPMHPAALDAYARVAGSPLLGNASSLHAAGRRARQVVEEAREEVAAALGARPSEVVFTAGGTESDNLAVKGLYAGAAAAARGRGRAVPRRVVVSAVEHHAVLDSAQHLADSGDAELVVLPVDRVGRVHPAALRAALDGAAERTAVVSVMWANSELGTVQPVAALAAVAAEYGVPLHSDAVQALATQPVTAALPGLAALTLTGHKVGGPLGVGALVLGRDVPCAPVLHGGGQERDLRSGTLATPLIAAFAAAVSATVQSRDAHARRLAQLRADLVRGVLAAVPGAQLNGPDGDADRLPSHAHFSFPGCAGDALLMLLDAQGVECSTGSACSAGVARPSHVLLAAGVDPDTARSSLRFSLGWTSTPADVAELLAALPSAVERARRAASRSADRAGLAAEPVASPSPVPAGAR